MQAKIRAQKSAEAMWANDDFSRHFGMKIEHVDEGYAKLSMLVLQSHCNGHGIAHGAAIFALADSASAFASNSRNQVAISQHNIITYLAPGKRDDLLIAEAQEISLRGRNCICDVAVYNQERQKLAEFRGMIRLTGKPLYEE